MHLRSQSLHALALAKQQKRWQRFPHFNLLHLFLMFVASSQPLAGTSQVGTNTWGGGWLCPTSSCKSMGMQQGCPGGSGTWLCPCRDGAETAQEAFLWAKQLGAHVPAGAAATGTLHGGGTQGTDVPSGQGGRVLCRPGQLDGRSEPRKQLSKCFPRPAPANKINSFGFYVEAGFYCL